MKRILFLSFALSLSVACQEGAEEEENDPVKVETPTVVDTTSSKTGSTSGKIGSGANAAPFQTLEKLPPASGTIARALALNNVVAAASGLPIAASQTDMFGNSYGNYLGTSQIPSRFPPGTGSYAACEALNATRGVIGTIGNTDMTACFVGKSISDKLNDEDYHIYEVDVGGMGLQDSTMKFKIRKSVNASGNLKAVEMMTCSDGKQSEHLLWDFSGDKIKISIKGSAKPGDAEVKNVTYSAIVTATGVNASGVLTGTKDLAFRYMNLFTSGRNNYVVSKATQTSDTLLIARSACERASLDGACDDRSEQSVASADLHDNNPAGGQSPNFLALGDGAAYIKKTGLTGVQQWVAATGLVANSPESAHGALVRKKKDTDLPELSSTFETIEFTKDEAWDCSGDATKLSPSQDTFASCGKYMVDQDVHLECGGGGTANLSTAVF